MKPYLRAANVTWDGLALEDVKEMHFSPAELVTFRLAPGDLLLSEASGSASEVGKPAMWRGEIEDCCFQNTLLRVRTQHLQPTYLLWYFKWLALSGQFGRGSRGVGIHHLGAKALSEWNVPIAPTGEQERIVAAIEEHFSRVDAGRMALERVRKNLKRMRTAVLQAAVTGRLLPLSNNSGPIGHQLPHGWSWQPLGRLITRLRNGIFVSRPVTDPVGPPILRISSVRPLALDITDVRYVPRPDDLRKVNDFVLEAGDLLFTRYSGNPEYVGACAVVPPTAPRLLYPDKLIRVQVDRSPADPRFVAMAASAGHTRREIRARVKTTAGQTGISGRDLRTVPFPLPPLEVQTRIIEEVDRSLTRIAALEDDIASSTKHASSLRTSILAAAFSGRLVPHDPNEPTLGLLERIAADRDGPRIKGRNLPTKATT